MPDPSWPKPDDRRLLGTSISRVDAPEKVTGAAKYTYDVRRPGMLHGKILCCPHAHARIRKLDVSAAEKMAGVRAVKVIQGEGTEIQWALDEIAAVAAVSEGVAQDAIRAIRVEYEVLPHVVLPEGLSRSEMAKPSPEERTGDPDAALAAAETRIEGFYGLPSVAHACLEAHGTVVEWGPDGSVTAWISTQGVSSIPQQLAEALSVPASSVRALTPHMGGGFGSKFSPDRWGVVCAELARQAKAPVKLMLERDEEMTVAGDRPSVYARVEVGATKDGILTAWGSRSWGSGGPGGSGSPPLPYVFEIKNRRQQHAAIPTHVASARAWRAPNHPQACFVTMAALEDLAAALAMDPMKLFEKNLDLTGSKARIYRDEMEVASRLMGWNARWHPRGAGSGSLRRGLGLSLHTWGGRGHRSACEIVIQPDGSVEARLASQDLGTGTRTVVAVVLAETLGLTVKDVRVSLGDSAYPPSGASGGSTTVGGVSASTRRAASSALEQLFEKVAPGLGAGPADLEAKDGRIQVRGNPAKGLTWKQAAARLGVSPLTVRGETIRQEPLTDSGVGGVQMADVSVDLETGVVRLEKLVAVQDCGLIVDRKTAESQVYGGLIMGIAYALSEEKIHDPATGRMLNANLEFYKLPGIADVGELVVHMMTGPGYDDRPVIGLGEPPVISPGAAISNAVANAIGVRVPYLPLTPDRVLAALTRAATERSGA